MPKPTWAGEPPKAEDLVSTSAPLILSPTAGARPEPIPAFVPMVWDLTASARKKEDEQITWAAQNIGQMVRENPDRGLVLLQSLPTDKDARTAFITAVKEALKGTSWEIAEDDPKESVLTLFNLVHLKRETPKLINTAPKFDTATSHRVDRFSSVKDAEKCYCVGNMQYKSDVHAEKIKKDYLAFNHAFNFADNYVPKSDNNFESIFAGALGENPKAKKSTVFTCADKTATTSSIIISDELIVPGTATATPRPEYNRRDAAVYPGVAGFTADDMWENIDITKVWSTSGFHNMTSCDNTFKFPDATLASLKAGADRKPLCVFGESIPSTMLAKDDGKKYLENIANNILQTLKNSFSTKNATTDDLPTHIKITVPINWGNHFSVLCLDIEIDPEKFVRLVNEDTADAPKIFKDCIKDTKATLVGSTITPDLHETNPDKKNFEQQLNAILQPPKFENVLGDMEYPSVEIDCITPFLQRGSTPETGAVDCGPITAEQGKLFLEGKKFLTVTKDFPELLKWNDNSVWGDDGPTEPNTLRKDYAAKSFSIGLETRRKFLQQCGAGRAEPKPAPKPEPDKVEAEKPDPRKKGHPNPEEQKAIRACESKFFDLLKSHQCEDNGKQVLGAPDKITGKRSVLYSRNGDTLTAEKSNATTALLMMYDLFRQGFTKVTITASPENRTLFNNAALAAGFKASDIKFAETKAENKPSSEQPSGMPPGMEEMMRNMPGKTH